MPAAAQRGREGREREREEALLFARVGPEKEKGKGEETFSSPFSCEQEEEW